MIHAYSRWSSASHSPFVPWKGALGLFEVPDDYARRAAA